MRVILWLVVWLGIYSAISVGLEQHQAGMSAGKQPVPEQISSGGAEYLDLRHNRSGNFKVPGTVNSAPVEFMVDTGASITSINQEVAWTAHIQNCTPRIFTTPAGRANGCVGVAQNLSFGNFRFENVEVAIMPQMEGSLLGMNVLSKLHMEQQGDVMRLSVQ